MGEIEGADEIALVAADGSIVATMAKPEVYEHRKEERAGRTFGITHGGHPYIKLINDSGDWLVGGKIKVLKAITYNDGMDQYRLTPMQLQGNFKEMGADASSCSSCATRCTTAMHSSCRTPLPS